MAESGTPIKPGIRAFLLAPQDRVPDEPVPADPHVRSRRTPWVYPYDSTFVTPFRDQVSTLRHAREQSMATLPSAISADFRDTLIQIFARRRFAYGTISGLFQAAGADPAWWVEGYGNAGWVASWLDALRVYAPEREETIIRRFCSIIMNSDEYTGRISRKLVSRHLAELDQPPPSMTGPRPLATLHPTVVQVAGPLLAIGHYDEALLKVCTALHSAIQQKCGRTDLHGSALMHAAFAPPTPRLQIPPQYGSQAGFLALFIGVVDGLHMPRAHTIMPGLAPDEALEWMNFLSGLFRVVDRSIRTE